MATEKLVGLWDTRKIPLSIGSALIFAEELLTLARAHKTSAEWIFLPDTFPWAPAHPLHSLLSNIEGLTSIRTEASVESVRSKFSKALPWPDWNTTRATYESTLPLQDLFKRHGALPPLTMKKEWLVPVETFVNDKARGRTPIAVHLKNNPKLKGFSNANFKEWERFLGLPEWKDEFVFFLIGNEEIPAEIRRLTSVVATQDHGFSLGQDAAVIVDCAAFMGMASGPCQMAVFSQKPYVIYKNPDHHTEEMKRELHGLDHFSFAGPAQKVIMRHETAEGLAADLKRMISGKHNEPSVPK